MRILVVEDEPLVAASLRAGLEAEGYTVDVAADGVEGLWLASEQDYGADDYLAKPFSYPVLLARLRALLRRDPVPRPAVLSAGDLRLDPAAHRCWRADREIALTAREFGVLELLLRRRGRP